MIHSVYYKDPAIEGIKEMRGKQFQIGNMFVYADSEPTDDELHNWLFPTPQVVEEPTDTAPEGFVDALIGDARQLQRLADALDRLKKNDE